MYSLTQKLVAEFLGTFALIFFGAGSICADQYLRSSGGLGLLGVALGTPELARDFPVWAGMSLEALTTFFLVLVVFATAIDEKGAFKAIAGFGIGLTITIGILVAGPLTGAALNPARAFGPALAANHWAHHGVYWIGPLAGGFIAGLLYDGLYLKKA